MYGGRGHWHEYRRKTLVQGQVIQNVTKLLNDVPGLGMVEIDGELRPPVAVLECAAADRASDSRDALEKGDESVEVVLTRHGAFKA